MAKNFEYRGIRGRHGSKEHLRALHIFRQSLKNNILGLEDKQWRDELLFILSRTEKKIREVQGLLPDTLLV